MKVLIVENELYLAQSIAAKLIDIGYVCEFAGTLKEAMRDEEFDVVLLSTNISDQNFQPLIEYHKKSIIIMMISYINNDTVSKPLKAGACDYILKPFMIEELIRKIELFQEYRKLKEENRMLQRHFQCAYGEMEKPEEPEKEKLPVLMKTNLQKNSDAYAFQVARAKGLAFDYVDAHADPEEAARRIGSMGGRELLYVINVQELKRGEKSDLFHRAAGKNVVFSSMDLQEETDELRTLEARSRHATYDDGEILSIEEYVKYVLTTHQHKYPDTELSKKLGISRKSLWEKRKKYGIVKKPAKK